LDNPDLTDLAVELIEPQPNSVESTRAPGRLEVRIPAPDRHGSVAVEVVIRFSTVVRPRSLDLDVFEPWDTADPEYRLYTQGNEGMIQVDDKIRLLAESLAPTSPRPWEALRAFWDFFFTRMSSGRIHHDEHAPVSRLDSIVTRGWFDCLAGSSLLAGLCRARGIPARVVNGFTLYEAIPSNHYWTEVLMPPFGWLGFDLASWDLAAGRLDRRWSDHYFGQVDARMTYQRFPRQILGPPGVRFPQAWYSLPAVRDGGLETTYLERDSGALLYRDWIKVRREPFPDPARVPER
jgi:transglutaminase-like putative cysteine protease